MMSRRRESLIICDPDEGHSLGRLQSREQGVTIFTYGGRCQYGARAQIRIFSAKGHTRMLRILRTLQKGRLRSSEAP